MSECILRAMIGKHVCVVLVAAAAACGSKKDGGGSGSGSASGSGSGSPAPPALAAPPLGVDAVKRMNFPYGAGADEYAKAVAAYKKQDWAAVVTAAQAALAKDALHLDAHRLLATALAQTGDKAGAAQHLAAALAGDWLKYGPSLADDKDLAAFLATPEGAQVTALSAKLGDATRTRIAASAIVVGRRSTFKWPSKSGYASSRGELYAYDVDGPDGPRFLRVTHTDDQVVAWLPSPSGAEWTVIGFDKIELPATPDAPALLGRTWIETIDAKTLAPNGKRATIPKARAVGVYYAAGDNLIAIAYPGSGRWDPGDGVAYSIDRATGKAAKVKAPAAVGAQATVSLDEATVDVPPAGVDATWAGDPAAAASLTVTASKKAIDVPESGKAPRASVVVSPDGKSVAFATWADPCATDHSLPSLYVFDGANGRLEHVLSAPSRFGARWIDNTRVIYEDGEGGLRVYDAAAGKEALHAAERGGLAVRALSSTPGPICKTAPPPPPAAGSGSDAGSGSAAPSDDSPPTAPQ
jgi:hypothetical protein